MGIAKFLVEQGADVNRIDRNGKTPLLYSCYHGSGLVGLLLRKGANINICDKDRCTPLIAAIRFEHFPVIWELLAWKADVNVRVDSKGNTPLHWATHYGKPNLLSRLLELGADP